MYVKAIKRLSGFLPTKYVYNPFKGLIEVDRCLVDGRLVTNSQASLSGHRGHRMVQPVYLTLFEVIKGLLGLVR